MAEPSDSVGDRSVAVGRDVIKSIVNTGDHNQFFIGNYASLCDAYVEPWSIFRQVNLDHFVGREWLLAKVDAFLHDNDCGYFILEAEAGLGKTAFLAWLTRERGYIHHFADLAPGLAGVETGLRNLAAQLALAYHLKPVGVLPSAASRPDYLSSLLRQAADQRQNREKIVLVVDALDEAGTLPNQNVLGLPQVLPESIFFIVSKRPVPVTLPVPTPTTPHLVCQLAANSDENQADMRRFLERVATWPRIDQALQGNGYTPEQFTNTLMKKCQGVWIYLHYVVHEIKRGERSPLDLTTLPDGIPQYYARYWKRWRDEDEDKWYEIYLPLITTLAAAREAITVERLAKWANVKMQAEILHRLLSVHWRHFITVVRRGQQVRYQFYHATLRDFCEGRVEREKLTKDKQEFVDELKRATIDACRRIMRNAQEPEVRRDAAFRLTRMRWFDDVRDVSPKEMLAYLELIGRYVYLSTDRCYLVQSITSMLDSAVNLCDRQQAQLLIYRAGMRGQLGECLNKAHLLDAAVGDYEAARGILKGLIGPEDGRPDDHKMLAQVGLGAGDIAAIRAEMLSKPEDQDRRRELLQEAANWYLAAVKAARAYGQDVILETGAYKELSYTYALLQNWTKAEEYYSTALEVLERGKEKVEDSEAYVSHYADILETGSNVHEEKGKSLTLKQNCLQALREYERAYELTQKEIAILERDLGESDTLVIAHLNSGLHLLAMSNCPDCTVSQPLVKACQDWQIALAVARCLGLADLEQAANEYLELYCQNRGIRQDERLA